MDELVEWLDDQVHVDLQAADAAKHKFDGGEARGEWREDPEHPGRIVDGFGTTIVAEGVASKEQTAHIEAWDPERARGESAVKAQLVKAAHLAWLEWQDARRTKPMEEWAVVEARWSAWWSALRRMALMYADRPGYREEWRP
ncbi:DUF6221 family protein [Streptomyces sp. NPDC057877]|uniref:DUF6221 family protein n=1 Tax=Streptomyces sp. NPDC057877 TaxID=3346269 RepID=UPI0036B577D1